MRAESKSTCILSYTVRGTTHTDLYADGYIRIYIYIYMYELEAYVIELEK